MKKSILILLTIILSIFLALAGCSGETPEVPNDNNSSVQGPTYTGIIPSEPEIF